MANSGKICVLADHFQDAVKWRHLFGVWTATHVTLKNFWMMPDVFYPPRYNGPVVLVGSCDNITPANIQPFLKEHPMEGLKVFVVDSTYGDNWEDVQTWSDGE